MVAGHGSQAWINMGKPVQMLVRLRSAGKAIMPSLGEGGWAASKFSDCTLEKWHDDFLEMWKTSGFTDRKLRIRFPEPNAGDYPAMPAPAAKL